MPQDIRINVGSTFDNTSSEPVTPPSSKGQVRTSACPELPVRTNSPSTQQQNTTPPRMAFSALNSLWGGMGSLASGAAGHVGSFLKAPESPDISVHSQETAAGSTPKAEKKPQFPKIAIDTSIIARADVQIAADENPAAFGKDFADRIKEAASGKHRLELVVKALDDANLSKEALSSLASHAHEALKSGLGDDPELGKALCRKLDRGLNSPGLTLDGRREMLAHAKEAFDACGSDELKKSWSSMVSKMVRHATKRDGQSMESLAPDKATRESLQDLLKYK